MHVHLSTGVAVVETDERVELEHEGALPHSAMAWFYTLSVYFYV